MKKCLIALLCVALMMTGFVFGASAEEEKTLVVSLGADPTTFNPVMKGDDDGHLIPVEKVRGRRASLDALLSHMEQTITTPEEQVIFISHGDSLQDAQYVAEQCRSRFGVQDVILHEIGPVIGAHSGPGTIALFFLGPRK